MWTRKILIRGVICCSCFLLIVFAVLPHVIAPVSEKILRKKVTELTGLEPFEMEIETVGLLGLGIGKITTGQTLSIDSVFCSYSPLSLLTHPSIEALTISGLQIQANWDANGPSFQDFPRATSTSVGAKNPNEENSLLDPQFLDKIVGKIAGIFPFFPKELEIRHSMLLIKKPGETVSVPFSIRCKTAPDNGGTLTIHLTLFPFCQAVDIDITADLKKGIRSAALTANTIDLAAFNRVLAWVTPESQLRLKGRADLSIAMAGHETGLARRSLVESSHRYGGKDPGEGGGRMEYRESALSHWKATLSHLGLGLNLEKQRDMGVFFQGELNNWVCNVEVNHPFFETYERVFSRESMDTQVMSPDESMSENQSGSPIVSGKIDSGKSGLPPSNSSIAVSGEVWLENRSISPMKLTYSVQAQQIRDDPGDDGGGNDNDGGGVKEVKNRWRVTVTGEEAIPPNFILSDPFQWITMESPFFQLDMSGSSLKGKGTLKAAVQNIDISGKDAVKTGWVKRSPLLEGATVSLKRVGAASEMQFDFSDGGKDKGKGTKGVELTFNADFQKIYAAMEETRILFPAISIPGELNVGRGGETDLSLSASMKGGQIVADAKGIRLEGIGFDLPMKLQLGSKGVRSKSKRKKGRVSVSRILLKDTLGASENRKISGGRRQKGRYHSIGNLEISTRQPAPLGVTLDGKLTVKLDGLASVDGSEMSASSTLKRAEISFVSTLNSLPETGFDLETSFQLAPRRFTQDIVATEWLASYASGASSLMGDDLEFAVTLAADGTMILKEDEMISSVNFHIDDGQLAMPSKNFRIKGIRSGIALDGLPNLKSSSGQLLCIDRIEANEIALSDIALKYTLESPTSLLVENIGFNWCNGRVSTEAMRISTEKNEYHLNLFCDRLGLSEILHQLGAFHSEGEGSLNGRIPISYVNGNISFDNGFLYSTPGKGGVIKITGTEVLLAGIPMDTPQFAQIDLAREALKNYQYEWAKLGFNTVDDELVVKMEFDGKPKDLLPFVYKKEVGSFVRVGASNPGSNFQGINLSVNLRLPFNKVMKFGNRINSLFR